MMGEDGKHDSTMLEMYALGALSPAEMAEVERYVATHPEAAAELAAYEADLMALAEQNAVAPPPRAKTAWMDRLATLEAEAAQDPEPPVIHAGSSPEDYAPWLNLPEMVAPAEYEDPFYIPISQTEAGLTAIVWVRDSVEREIHHDAIEKFYVLEGACDIDIEGEVHRLKAGDYLSIPLHKWHSVQVTSEMPCKLVVQRIAA